LRHLERARSLFERAKTIDPTLALDPESVARTTAAEALLIQGEAEARAANLDEAIAFFEEAVELDPTLDIAPDTLARQMVAEARIHQGEELAQQGAIDEALAAYEEAQRMYPAAIPAAKWNNLCWYGSVWNHAHDVLDACERAIEGAPDEMTFYESRGLARALTGDTAGAIDDFTHYIALREQHGLADMARWEGWIDELEANRNPFDEATLRALRAE
jgi:tetratricopeptide (TPR) repeat protein